MKNLYRRTSKGYAFTTVFALAAITGCGSGDNSPKEYTLAGRVVDGNPYYGTPGPRPGTKVIITYAAETFVLPNDVTNYREEPYTQLVADGDGRFSLRVPAGRYWLTSIPPPGGNPNDGVITSDDVCGNFEIVQFPPREGVPEGEGQNVVLGHDFCVLLPVTD